MGEKREKHRGDGEWGIRWRGRAAVEDLAKVWVVLVLHRGLQQALGKQGGGEGQFISCILLPICHLGIYLHVTPLGHGRCKPTFYTVTKETAINQEK